MTLKYRMAASALLLGAALPRAHAQPRRDPWPATPATLQAPIPDAGTPAYDAARNARTTIVAEVNGREISLADVGEAIDGLPNSVRALPFESLFPAMLDRLVRQQALVIRAQRAAVDEDPAVRRKMRAAADRVLANEFLRIESAKDITETALLDRYNKDYAGRPGPDEVRLRVIMLPTEDEATAAIAQLRKGADFADLARRISKDPTAPAGGDLGFLARDRLNPEIGAAAFLLRPGELGAYPVRSSGSWFVVRVDARRQGAAPPFLAVREQLMASLARERTAEIVRRALDDVVVRTYSIAGTAAAERTGEAGRQ